MSLLSIKNSSFGMWISVVFWICISVVIIDLLQKLITILASFYNSKRLKKYLAKKMEDLTDTEKDIVYKIFVHDKYKFNVLGDASVTKLKNQGIIFHSEVGDILTGFSCGLQPIVRVYLIENPNYLKNHVKLRKESILTELEELKKNMPDVNRIDYGSMLKRDNIERLEKIVEEYDNFIEKKI